jgi:hypothetical protein
MTEQERFNQWVTVQMQNPYHKGIKQSTIEGLGNWLFFARDPGDFLMAVLKHELFESIHQADDHNEKHIVDIVRFIHNQLPYNSHGDHWERWEHSGGLVGQERVWATTHIA